VVKIDYFLPGCPPSGDTIWEGLRRLLTGRAPDLPYVLCKYE
jgi:NAD-reducing hydrogenase small subunit